MWKEPHICVQTHRGTHKHMHAQQDTGINMQMQATVSYLQETCSSPPPTCSGGVESHSPHTQSHSQLKSLELATVSWSTFLFKFTFFWQRETLISKKGSWGACWPARWLRHMLVSCPPTLLCFSRAWEALLLGTPEWAEQKKVAISKAAIYWPFRKPPWPLPRICGWLLLLSSLRVLMHICIIKPLRSPGIKNPPYILINLFSYTKYYWVLTVC